MKDIKFKTDKLEIKNHDSLIQTVREMLLHLEQNKRALKITQTILKGNLKNGNRCRIKILCEQY